MIKKTENNFNMHLTLTFKIKKKKENNFNMHVTLTFKYMY